MKDSRVLLKKSIGFRGLAGTVSLAFLNVLFVSPSFAIAAENAHSTERSDELTQAWDSAYKKLRKSQRSTSDYKEAAQAVAPGAAPHANPRGARNERDEAVPATGIAASDLFMDPAKVPRVVTFGKNNDAQVVLPDAEPRVPAERAGPVAADAASVIQFTPSKP